MEKIRLMLSWTGSPIKRLHTMRRGYKIESKMRCNKNYSFYFSLSVSQDERPHIKIMVWINYKYNSRKDSNTNIPIKESLGSTTVS